MRPVQYSKPHSKSIVKKTNSKTHVVVFREKKARFYTIKKYIV